MTLFDKYSVNGKFENYSLESMLLDLNISKKMVDEIIIRYSTSSLLKEFIEKLKKTNENENNSIEVDYLIKGRIPNINFNNSEDLLINNITQEYSLFQRKDFVHGGLEIDKNYRIISKDGTISENLYALGLSTEGSNFFTLILGRPYMFSSVFYDNNNVAIELIKKLNKEEILYA